MQPDLREPLLDPGEQPLEPIDCQVWMDSALHQDASPIHFNSFRDLLVDLVEFENIAFFGLRSLQRPVKRAECAVFGAEVGVVDVPVNDVRNDAFGVEAPADSVSLKAQ